MDGTHSHPGATPTQQTEFEPTAPGQPSQAIVDVLATVTDSSPLEIPPLYETIDPDALEQLFDHAATTGRASASVALEFAVDDWTVVVTGDGRVLVYDGSGSDIGGADDR